MEWREALTQPFPEAWRAILEREVGFYRRFAPATRARFEEQVKVFVLTKEFLSRDGMTIDDTVKLIVAATACRLSVNLPGEHYTRLKLITLWPDVIHTNEDVIGTACRNKVVLSWRALRRGLDVPDDGHNVGYHELAHVLDDADSELDGTPLIVDPELRGRWDDVVDEHLRQLQAAKRDGLRTFLDPYGAKNRSELFAVATETFFERPRGMRLHHPRLYQLLSEYFRQDPSASAPLDEPSDPLIGTRDETRPPAASPPPAPETEDHELPPGLVRRAQHEAARIAAGAPDAPASRVPVRLDLKDPDSWQAKDFVALAGGLLMAFAFLLFIVGRSPLFVLAAGIVLLLIAAFMRRDE